MPIQSASPFNVWQAIATDNAADLPLYTAKGLLTNAIYVGSTGDVVAVDQRNVAVTWTGVPAGTILPIAVRRINATGTTAQNLLAIYAN